MEKNSSVDPEDYDGMISDIQMNYADGKECMDSAYGKSVCPERRRSVVSTGERRRTPLGFDSGRSKRIMREPVLRQAFWFVIVKGLKLS